MGPAPRLAGQPALGLAEAEGHGGAGMTDLWIAAADDLVGETEQGLTSDDERPDSLQLGDGRSATSRATAPTRRWSSGAAGQRAMRG